MFRRSYLPFAALTLVMACASSGPRSGSSAQREILTAEEIAAANVGTAFEAVRQLRPEFLRSRGTMSMRDPSGEYAVVYVNGMRMGGPEQLNTIRAGDVASIRFVSASDATTRWCTGHAGGAIEVIVKS
jgi:hypothetical protein